MTRDQRLNAWRAVVLATLLANGIYAASGAMTPAAIATSSLVVMLALLATTPPDAIVLPRGRSERIIAAGFVVAAAIATRGHPIRVGVALVELAVGLALLAACRRRSISAWWTAVLLWQPVVLSLIRAVR